MNTFSSLFSIVITLFLLLCVGFFCRKVGVISESSSKGFSKLILCVGQPMMIVSALTNAEYSEENLTLAWKTTLIGFAMHFFMALCAFLICRKISKFDWGKLFEFSLVFGNCGFIGFPILDAVLGDGLGRFLGAFYTISSNILLWIWGIAILARGRSDIRLTVKKALVNYGTVPCLIGIVLFLCKVSFQLPAPISGTIKYISDLCTPISVLVTGGLIATMPLKKMFSDYRLYLQAGIKLFVVPMIVCVLTKLLGFTDLFVMLSTVMVAMPSAAAVSMMGEVYDIEPAFASQTVGMTSILVTGSLPVVMLFANWILTF